MLNLPLLIRSCFVVLEINANFVWFVAISCIFSLQESKIASKSILKVTLHSMHATPYLLTVFCIFEGGGRATQSELYSITLSGDKLWP